MQPWAAEVVKQHGDLSLAGVTFPNPANTCWPEPVPFLFKHAAMQMLQLPDQIVMLFNEDHEVRFAAACTGAASGEVDAVLGTGMPSPITKAIRW